MKHKFSQLFSKGNLMPLVIFGVLIFLTYLNVLNAPFLVDDKAGILENPLVGKFDSIYKYPSSSLRHALLYISYHVGGLEPFAYRIFNILFHFGTVTMLYLVVKKLINRNVAILAGIIFAIHPLLTESVTWISAVTYPQYSFFFMLTLYSYLRSDVSKRWAVASYVFYLLSMLSSEKAVALPAVIFFLELSRRSLKKNWKRIIPFGVIAMLIGGIILTGVGARVDAFKKDYYIKPQFYNPVEHDPYAITYYAQLFLLPVNLTIYHSELSITVQEFLIRWFFFIALIVSIITSYTKNKNLFFWLSFYIIALAPTLIPLNIVWVVAERYAYLSIAGLAVTTAMLFDFLLKKKKIQTASYAVITLVFFMLMGLAILRNVDWQSAANLWTSSVAASPHSSNAHNNMGDIYAQRKDYAGAIREFQRATELQPGDADPRHNLGIVLTMVGRYQEAADAYLGALQIDPTLYKSNQNLGVVYYRLKKYPESEEHLIKALKYGPPNIEISKLLEEVRSLQGK